MRSKETFFRSREVKRESRMLPAPIYNLTRIVRHRSGEPAVFVPIRSMLYMAVIDDEEIIFVDGAVSRSQILISWQRFRPQDRSGLDEPIPFEAVYFTQDSPNLMGRLQSEFQRALQQLQEKQRPDGSAEVVPLHRS